MLRYTHLGRIIDPRIPSNLLVILATLATGATVLALGHGLPELIRGAGGVYLAWMIGREIDPDRVLTANAGAIVTAGLMLFDPSAAPGALALVGVAARITIRSTGLTPLVTDLAVLAVGAVLLSIGSFAWVGALALAVAVVMDGRWDADAGEEEPGRRQMLWGGAIGVGALVAAGIWATQEWEQPAGWMFAIAAAGLVGGAILSRFEPVRSITDFTRQPLHPDRLRVTRLLVITASTLIALIGGAAGVVGMAPAWIVLAIGGLLRAIGTSSSEPLAP